MVCLGSPLCLISRELRRARRTLVSQTSLFLLISISLGPLCAGIGVLDLTFVELTLIVWLPYEASEGNATVLLLSVWVQRIALMVCLGGVEAVSWVFATANVMVLPDACVAINQTSFPLVFLHGSEVFEPFLCRSLLLLDKLTNSLLKGRVLVNSCAVSRAERPIRQPQLLDALQLLKWSPSCWLFSL